MDADGFQALSRKFRNIVGQNLEDLTAHSRLLQKFFLRVCRKAGSTYTTVLGMNAPHQAVDISCAAVVIAGGSTTWSSIEDEPDSRTSCLLAVAL